MAALRTLDLASLGYDPRLEDGAAQGMGFELLRRANAKQVTHEPAVEEMQLRRLDQPLADIAEEWCNAREDVAGFEDPEPALRGVVGNARVSTELREVYELSGACRRDAQKRLECEEIANREDLSDVPLDIGADVVCEPVAVALRALVRRGVSAAEHHFEETLAKPSAAAQLGCGKRQQLEQRGTTSERLRDARKQQEVLRTPSRSHPVSPEGHRSLATTHSGKLVHIQQFSVGSLRYLRFNYTTADAAGQNMTSKATLAACEWIRDHYPSPLKFIFLAPVGAGLELTMRDGDGFVTVVTPASPLGKAILGRELGDTVEISVNGEERDWTVTYIG